MKSVMAGVFIALDNTDDANTQSQSIARELGGKAYLPQFPNGVKDANEWLAQHQATTDDATDLLNKPLHFYVVC